MVENPLEVVLSRVCSSTEPGPTARQSHHIGTGVVEILHHSIPSDPGRNHLWAIVKILLKYCFRINWCILCIFSAFNASKNDLMCIVQTIHKFYVNVTFPAIYAHFYQMGNIV